MAQTIWTLSGLATLALVAGCNGNNDDTKVENAAERSERAAERGTSSGSQSLENAAEKTEEAGERAADRVDGEPTFHDKVERAYDKFGNKIDEANR